jgi:hypothetical protein
MAAASIRNNPAGDRRPHRPARRVTAVHIVLGVAVVVVNLAAGAWGAWAWWWERRAPGFWPLLRAGQALVAVEAALGGVLVLEGKELPSLHLVYGLTPLAVAFFAEQLRAIAAQAELDRRGLDGRDAVAALPEADQRGLVRAILRRELGVMAASALVVALLGMRAAEWF